MIPQTLITHQLMCLSIPNLLMMSDTNKPLCYNWKKNVRYMNSLCASTEVIEASKSYVQECNPVMMFMNEHYDITGDHTKDTVAFRDLFTDF